MKLSRKKCFTENETIALMHENAAVSFRAIADYVEKNKLDWRDVVELLREAADSQEAQCVVVELRESL